MTATRKFLFLALLAACARPAATPPTPATPPVTGPTTVLAPAPARGIPERPSDADFWTGYSYDAAGRPRSFLTSEENYRYVKSLQERNLIVPITGDFGGPKAIRAIGTFLKDHNAVVRAFYVSNVEQYLFGDGKAGVFYANVATLPVDSTSMFIGPYSMRRVGGGQIESVCPIQRFVMAAIAGRVQTNGATLACIQ